MSCSLFASNVQIILKHFKETKGWGMSEIARRASVKKGERGRFYAWLRRASAGMIDRANKKTAHFELALREFVGCPESLFEWTEVENDLKDPTRFHKYRKVALRLVRLLDRGYNLMWVEAQLTEWETEADRNDGFVPSLFRRKEVEQLARILQNDYGTYDRLADRIKRQIGKWQKEIDRDMYVANFPMSDEELYSLLMGQLHRRISLGQPELKALLRNSDREKEEYWPNLSTVEGASSTLTMIKWAMADGASVAEAINAQLIEYGQRVPKSSQK
jgi:hypothetical protein